MKTTNTNSESQSHFKSEKIFTKHEREKKRQYNYRITKVEPGTFNSLVSSVNGGMYKERSAYNFINLLLKRSQISLVVAMKKLFQ